MMQRRWNKAQVDPLLGFDFPGFNPRSRSTITTKLEDVHKQISTKLVEVVSLITKRERRICADDELRPGKWLWRLVSNQALIRALSSIKEWSNLSKTFSRGTFRMKKFAKAPI